MERPVPDFSHLSKYAITDETTAEYTFNRIEGEPSVIVRPAHECNPGWLMARTEANIALAKAITAVTKPGQLVAEDLTKQSQAERDTDRKLIAFHCVTGWGTAPVDKNGKAVEFSPDNAFSFLAAIPNEMLDPLRNFVGNLYNFYPERRWTQTDGEPLGN